MVTTIISIIIYAIIAIIIYKLSIKILKANGDSDFDKTIELEKNDIMYMSIFWIATVPIALIIILAYAVKFIRNDQ